MVGGKGRFAGAGQRLFAGGEQALLLLAAHQRRDGVFNVARCLKHGQLVGRERISRIGRSSLDMEHKILSQNDHAVAANRADLITKGPIVPMDRLASGLRVDQDENMFVTYVWTGSNGDGTASLQDCNGWTNALSTQSGVAGNARRIASPTPTDWTTFGGRTCDARRRFYCFQVP